jgi:two-component system, NarL family, nitrate/nitrite response regulator NarL
MTPRVVIVEDHGLIAQTVAAALRAHDVHVHVIDAPSTTDLVGAVIAQDPTLALLDLDLGHGRDSLELIPPLVEVDVPVVMVTGVSDSVRLAQCVRAGAVGLLDKSVSFEELLASVREAIARGGLMTKYERDEHLAFLRKHEAKEAGRLAPFAELTPREADVLRALVAGRTVEEIAHEAVVSISTVRTQVRAILRKLGVSSQLAAVGLARQAGWPEGPA